MRRAAFAALLLLSACFPVPPQPSGGAPRQAAGRTVDQEAFWQRVQALCGRAFAGRLVEGNETDTAFARGPLVMHVRRCAPGEVRMALHVGADRSRAWVLARTAAGLRLTHEHRTPGGAPDPPTGYGGETRVPGSAARQDFPADARTVAMLPGAEPNVWTLEIAPGRAFGYAMRREGTDRRFRLEFDLRVSVGAPPPPWGEP